MGRLIAAYRHHPDHGIPISQEIMGRWANITQAQISRFESGRPEQQIDRLNFWAELLGIPQRLLWFAVAAAIGEYPGELPTHAPAPDQRSHATTVESEYVVHAKLQDGLEGRSATSNLLDDWTYVIAAHGRETRYRPADNLLVDLLDDVAQLEALRSNGRHTCASLRQVTVLLAQLSGLVSLTLLKLGSDGGARRWGRTARVIAADGADPAVLAWAWAQEAYRVFYAGDPVGAAKVAVRARELSGGKIGVGTALSAALEARARAAVGDAEGTRTAIAAAETLLAGLRPEEAMPSAFGYDEAQLRFHEGNAYTHLGDTESAWAAQRRALELYPAADFLDRALIGLDRAACLTHDGDIRLGVENVVDVIERLTQHQRDGLIVTRACQVLDQLPLKDQKLGIVRAARDLLAVCTREGTDING